MKILFVTNIPSPYRVDFFNELGKYCELNVCFERKTATDRDDRWNSGPALNFNVHCTTAKTFRMDKTIGFELIRKIKGIQFDRLIIAGYSSPSVIFAISYCRLHGINYIIESDGGGFKVDGVLVKIAKKFLLCGASAHFTTNEEHIVYLQSLGVDRCNIYKYPFTSLKEQDIVSAPASEDEKLVLRKGLGITEKKVVLSVGQFIPRKGFDLLLDAATDFSHDTGTYIIGGIPGDEYIMQKEHLGLNQVYFIDFKQSDELRKWYRAADVFVLPTRYDVWGLVINEAMAQGLPVVTTDKCAAGLELVNGENGELIPAESVEAIRSSINYILSDEILRYQMSKSSLNKIKEYTIGNMVKVHLESLGTN